jgi:hypothetical protein
MCIACVMNSQTCRPPSNGTPDPGKLAAWSPEDAARAATVYRQLPRWSRQLFDLLSAAPARRFSRSEVQASLFPGGDAWCGVDEVCDWAAAFCAASGRPLPVRQETQSTGAAVYWIEQPAASLFQSIPAQPTA